MYDLAERNSQENTVVHQSLIKNEVLTATKARQESDMSIHHEPHTEQNYRKLDQLRTTKCTVLSFGNAGMGTKARHPATVKTH